MNIIYILIPLAIIIVIVAIAIFFWAVKSDQFEDLERHGYSILFDDDIKANHDKGELSNDLSNDSSNDSSNDLSNGLPKGPSTKPAKKSIDPAHNDHG